MSSTLSALRPSSIACVPLLAACADSIERTYDPCSPLTLSVDAEISEAELGGVEDAIAAWADVVPVRFTIGSGAQAADVLPIRFEPGDTFYRAIYWDGLGQIAISRDRLAPEDYGIALAHEMGHAFGLHHIELADRVSVMNVGNLEHSPTAADAALIEARWDACLRDVTAR